MGVVEKQNVEYSNEVRIDGQEVAVLANFNAKGELRPVFLQLEDEEQQRMRLKVYKIYSMKEEHEAAWPLIRYEIGLLIQGSIIRGELIYSVELHRWWLRRL